MASMPALLVALKPKIILTAPDGKALWIDPLASDPTGGTPGPSLWPAGFTPTLTLGDIPTNDPNVTASPSAFFASEAPALLAAPGPLGVAWGLWLLGLLVVVASPLLAAFFAGRHTAKTKPKNQTK